MEYVACVPISKLRNAVSTVKKAFPKLTCMFIMKSTPFPKQKGGKKRSTHSTITAAVFKLSREPSGVEREIILKKNVAECRQECSHHAVSARINQSTTAQIDFYVLMEPPILNRKPLTISTMLPEMRRCIFSKEELDRLPIPRRTKQNKTNLHRLALLKRNVTQ